MTKSETIQRCRGALVCLLFVLTGAGCSGDHGVGTSGGAADDVGAALAEALSVGEDAEGSATPLAGDDLQRCSSTWRTFMERMEVPDGIDTDDGIDDIELSLVQTAYEEATAGVDLRSGASRSMADEQSEPFFRDLAQDFPEVAALLVTVGKRASGSFQSVDDRIG